MQIDTISLIIYAALFIFTGYNLSLAWKLAKLQTQKLLRHPAELDRQENEQLQLLSKDKHRWSILGRVFFWGTILVALTGDLTEVAFFLTLYSICNIIVLRNNITTINILAVK